MKVQELCIEVTESARLPFCDSGWYEASSKDKGELFRIMQKAHGRCTSKIYVDVPVAFYPPRTTPVGWVFVKREQYEDCEDTYLKETWVTYKAA